MVFIVISVDERLGSGIRFVTRRRQLPLLPHPNFPRDWILNFGESDKEGGMCDPERGSRGGSNWKFLRGWPMVGVYCRAPENTTAQQLEGNLRCGI